jgi:hypothetical protein
VAALLTIGVACQSSSSESMTGLRVSADWTGQIDQLEYAVMTASGAVHAPERRPGVAQGPLTSDVDVVIYLADQMAGQHVRCVVTGYWQGAQVQQAEAQADVVAGSVVDVRVNLTSPGIGPDGGAGAGGNGTGGAGGAGGGGGKDAGPGGRGNGQACNSGAECSSGACVDGVCCDGACSGTCQACNVAGKLGTCSPVPAGTRDTMCQQEAVKTCGLDGTCNGAGACRKYPAGTTCVSGTCSGNMLLGAGACDGNGTCQLGTSLSCGAYGCDSGRGACKTTCSSNGDCVSPNVCGSGVCGTFKPLGQVCTAASDCASGNCVDGVCCSTSSCGTCLACNLAGVAGTCRPVTAGIVDPHGRCVAQPVATCGLDGTCNGNGACAAYANGTVCRMSRVCMNGVCR